MTEEQPFDGMEFDENGRVIDPDIISGAKQIIRETEDFCLTYEMLDLFHDDVLHPVVHCWVYRYSPTVKRQIMAACELANEHFGILFAIAPTTRPQLIKYIQTMPFQVVDEEDGLQLYEWRSPNEIH